MGNEPNDLRTLFDEVDLNGRAQLVWEYGQFEVSRQYYANKVSLYCLPGFYAEVFYNPKKNRVFRIEPITDSEGLNKFLPYIELK